MRHSSNLFTGCVAALRKADAAVLKPHQAAIQGMPHLDDDSKKVIAQRIFLSSFAPDALWQELTEFCERHDQEDETSDQEYEFGCSVADALLSFPDQFAAQVLDILKSGEDTSGWLELMAVRLAGRLQLKEAIPYLVDLLGDAEVWACEDAHWALKRIDPDSVVKELSGRYATENIGLRMAIACILEDIHTDFSVQTCLDLLDQEQDQNIREILIESVLMNFSSDGIEPARQYVFSTPKSPEVLEVRQDLLVASTMMGVQFPELEAWTEDSKTDTDFRREWYKDHPLRLLADSFENNGDESSWADEEVNDDFEDEQSETIIRHDLKIGRNDSCPCGSGKKYKKCCISKRIP